MLRQATDADLNQVEEGYQKHFLHEKEHGAFTVFQEGVYPTRADAAKALSKGALHVHDEDGNILGSIIDGVGNGSAKHSRRFALQEAGISTG